MMKAKRQAGPRTKKTVARMRRTKVADDKKLREQTIAGHVAFFLDCERQRRQEGRVAVLHIAWGHKGRFGFFAGFDKASKEVTLVCGSSAAMYGPYSIPCESIHWMRVMEDRELLLYAIEQGNKSRLPDGSPGGTHVDAIAWARHKN